MNDKKVDDLLTEYSQSLGHSRHASANVKVKTGRTIIWKPALVTCIGAALIATFTFLPRRAEAAPMDRVFQALKETKFWMATCRTKEQGGSWIMQYRSFHQDDKTRGESPVFGGPPKTIVTIIDSESEYTDHSDLPYILKSKFSSDKGQQSEAMIDPLKNSLQLIGGMRADFARTDGIKYQGSDAYSLSLKFKKTGKKYFELFVQRSSNLPLAVLIDNPGTPKVKPFEYRIDYSYVPPKDLSLFTPDPKKYFVDIEAEKAAYAELWSKTPVSPDSPTIFASSISPDGTIWITFGVKNHNKKGWTPLKLLNKNYAPASWFMMNSYGTSKDFRVSGYEVITTNYIPIDPTATKPAEIQIEFSAKAAFLDEPKDVQRKTVTSVLTKEQRDFPAHFPCFMRDIRTEFLVTSQIRARARALQKRGDYLEAGRAFEKEFHLLKRYAFMHQPLREAIECYEKLGMKKKVQELKQLAKSALKPPK